ncbi:MAG: serine/threonine-protein kinase, partial [bacterium]
HPSAGEMIADRYRLERLAGVGGMGHVFEAVDTRLNRRVAVKFISTATDGTLHESLMIEARAMAGLDHPNLCRVLEAVIDTTDPFIVMDWVEGVDLRSAAKTLDLTQRIALFVRIVEAVGSMHEEGLTHRDLKPGNILLNRRGEPVIVDFGLAGHTAKGDLKPGGTPGHAAPEQFNEPPSISPRCDVYSLGVILFELLTLRPPFSASTNSEMLALQRKADPPVPEAIVPDLPAGLQRICLQALERDPALRYSDARELLEDLRRHLRGETVLARPSMLAARFEAQIEEQLDRARHWESQGLITREESRRLYRQLTSLLRPDSPWIIDSRKLTTSQVGLYLGGWMTLLAITVGMWFSWNDLSSTLHIAIPSTVSALLFGLGVTLQLNQMKRYALGFLLTASITTPALVWVILRETGALGTVSDAALTTAVIFRIPSNRPGLRLESKTATGRRSFAVVIGALWRLEVSISRVTAPPKGFQQVSSFPYPCDRADFMYL